MSNKSKLKKYCQIKNTPFYEEYIMYHEGTYQNKVIISEDNYESLIHKYYSFVNHSDTLVSTYSDEDNIFTWGDNKENGMFNIAKTDFVKTLKNQCRHYLRMVCDLDEDPEDLEKYTNHLYKEREGYTVVKIPRQELNFLNKKYTKEFPIFRVDEEILKKID